MFERREHAKKIIVLKTNMWIERSCPVPPIETKDQENGGERFYRLAKNQSRYVRFYRAALDEHAQYKKELWLTVTDPNCNPSVKVMSAREQHAITNTSVLLNTDLPFVLLSDVLSVGMH